MLISTEALLRVIITIKIYSANYLGGLLYSDDSSISLSDNVVGWFQLNNSAAVLGLNAEL